MISEPTGDAGSPLGRAEEGRLAKAEARALEKRLRVDLLEAQSELQGADYPVLILPCGVDGAGKGEIANALLEWVDPRGVVTRAYNSPSSEELGRPPFWRYWRDLPAHGEIGVFLSAWYHDPLLDRVHGRIDDQELDERLERICAFERTLTDSGALVIKLWLHLGRDAQEQRLSALEQDPLQSWRVTDSDWEHWRKYDRFVATTKRLIERTDRAASPWTILNGEDKRWARVRAGQLFRDRIRARQRQAGPPTRSRYRAPLAEAQLGQGALAQLDLEQTIAKKEYRRTVKALQARLHLLSQRARERGTSTVFVFEGWDASGKGGAIRRVTAALDARDYRVTQIAAPNDDERAHHYLWRFWRKLPGAGATAIFDRSWYGRVLVERVEGFATEEEWTRAYDEIRQFEEQLVDSGTLVVKLWMHISRDEQQRRFQRREQTPYKRWKLTEEDWRNRARWHDYELAVEEMLARTGTATAPWTLIEGNCKRTARIRVLRTACEALERSLGVEDEAHS